MDQGGRRAKRAEANPGSSVRPVEPGGCRWARALGAEPRDSRDEDARRVGLRIVRTPARGACRSAGRAGRSEKGLDFGGREQGAAGAGAD